MSGRAESGAKSGRQDTRLTDATNLNLNPRNTGHLVWKDVAAGSRSGSEKWGEGHPIWQEELQVESMTTYRGN